MTSSRFPLVFILLFVACGMLAGNTVIPSIESISVGYDTVIYYSGQKLDPVPGK
ncbi:MAG: hypothetical protein U0X39_15375 [Bacteroidales bacterium]